MHIAWCHAKVYFEIHLALPTEWKSIMLSDFSFSIRSFRCFFCSGSASLQNRCSESAGKWIYFYTLEREIHLCFLHWTRQWGNERRAKKKEIHWLNILTLCEVLWNCFYANCYMKHTEKTCVFDRVRAHARMSDKTHKHIAMCSRHANARTHAHTLVIKLQFIARILAVT